ncbi:MAG: type II toxin-antitoxin system VapC family toxin [Pseudonocardiaceae bacterium]
MRVYLDSSAVLKRVLVEPESADLVAGLDKHHTEGDVLVSSSLAWIEVARALRSLRGATLAEVADDVDAALSGVAEHPLVAEVVALARRVNPAVLRSLDAIHLASALLSIRCGSTWRPTWTATRTGWMGSSTPSGPCTTCPISLAAR